MISEQACAEWTSQFCDYLREAAPVLPTFHGWEVEADLNAESAEASVVILSLLNSDYGAFNLAVVPVGSDEFPDAAVFFLEFLTTIDLVGNNVAGVPDKLMHAATHRLTGPGRRAAAGSVDYAKVYGIDPEEGTEDLVAAIMADSREIAEA